MAEIFTVENIIALFTLTTLEIVLGIDNIVFIAILVAKVPREQQARIRQVGLLAAMGMRILLLLAISWIMLLTTPLFSILEHGVSGRDLILLAGGLFLLGKATFEIHEKLEGPNPEQKLATGGYSGGAVILQIMLLDIIFSLDSVITAVGMAQHLSIMILAVIIAVGVMMIFSGTVSEFINRHPTLKMLALSFLLLVGVMLVAEGCGKHIDRGYIYFAMGFSLLVESLNLRAAARRKKSSPAASL